MVVPSSRLLAQRIFVLFLRALLKASVPDSYGIVTSTMVALLVVWSTRTMSGLRASGEMACTTKMFFPSDGMARTRHCSMELWRSRISPLSFLVYVLFSLPSPDSSQRGIPGDRSSCT